MYLNMVEQCMEKRLEEILCAHFTTKHEFEFRHESAAV